MKLLDLPSPREASRPAERPARESPTEEPPRQPSQAPSFRQLLKAAQRTKDLPGQDGNTAAGLLGADELAGLLGHHLPALVQLLRAPQAAATDAAPDTTAPTPAHEHLRGKSFPDHQKIFPALSREVGPDPQEKDPEHSLNSSPPPSPTGDHSPSPLTTSGPATTPASLHTRAPIGPQPLTLSGIPLLLTTPEVSPSQAPPPSRAAEVARHVQLQIATNARGGVAQLELNLGTQGNIRMELILQDHTASVLLRTTNALIGRELQQELHSLARALQDLGLETEALHVETGADPDADPRDPSRHHARASRPGEQSTDEPSPVPTLRRLHQGLLDIVT